MIFTTRYSPELGLKLCHFCYIGYLSTIPYLERVCCHFCAVNFDLFTEACYLDSLVQRAGRVNRKGKLGDEGQGIVVVCVPEGWNNRASSLPYDYKMLDDSIAIIEEEAENITSELDYVTLTNLFYDQSWQSSQEAEERFEEIWNRVHMYIEQISQRKA